LTVIATHSFLSLRHCDGESGWIVNRNESRRLECGAFRNDDWIRSSYFGSLSLELWTSGYL
jgi:hypothetical protein